MMHTLVADNKKKKGKFEKLFLDGRPPVSARRHERRRLLRRHAGHVHRRARRSAVQPVRRVGVAVPHDVVHLAEHGAAPAVGPAGLLADAVLLRPARRRLLRPGIQRPHRSRPRGRHAHACSGGTAFAIYPFNRYRRVELFGGFSRLQESFNDPALEAYSQQYQQEQFGRTLFNNGTMMPLGVAFVQETTIFREFGPLAGSTMRRQLRERAEDRRHAVAPDLRRRRAQVLPPRRQRPAGAARARLQELGRATRTSLYFGGNSRAARLRLPVVHRPERVLRERRAALPADRGDGDADRRPRRHPRHALRRHRRRLLRRPAVQVLHEQHDARDADHRLSTASARTRSRSTGRRARSTASAWSTRRASYGISLPTFALGFPVHFDWSWRTLMNKDWEDVVFHMQGGSAEFRKPKFTMWIGYDFGRLSCQAARRARQASRVAKALRAGACGHSCRQPLSLAAARRGARAPARQRSSSSGVRPAAAEPSSACRPCRARRTSG